MAWISTNPLPAPKFQSIREDAVTRSAACVKSHLGVQGAKTGRSSASQGIRPLVVLTCGPKRLIRPHPSGTFWL